MTGEKMSLILNSSNIVSQCLTNRGINSNLRIFFMHDFKRKIWILKILKYFVLYELTAL